MSTKAELELLISLRDEATAGLDALGGKLGGLGGLALGGAGLAVGAVGAVGVAALDIAGDIDAAGDQMTAALGLSAEEAAEFEGTMTDIFANNYGEDMDDIAASITAVQQNLSRVGDEGNLQQLTEDALALRDVFGEDVSATANAAATLIEEFGLTSDEAMDFIARGMQRGLNASGDFLDSIGEYSTQFSEGGANAEEFFSLMESGMQGGMLGTDKAADLFKEFRVRIQDGSTATAAGLEMIGINAEDMARRMEDGTLSAADAWQEVQTALNAVEDENVRMQAGVALMGTQYEDLGQDAVAAMNMTSTSMADLEGATDSLNIKYDNFGSFMEGVWRKALVELAPLGTALMDMANGAMPMIQGALEQMGVGLSNAIDFVMQLVDAFGAGGLEGVMVMLLPMLMMAFDQMVAYLGEQLPVWQAQFLLWADAAWLWLQAAVPPALEQLGQMTSALLAYLADNLPGWIATLLEWGTAAVAWLGEALPPLIEQAGIFLGGLAEWALSVGLPELERVAGEWATALWVWIRDDLIPEVGPALMEFLSTAEDALDDIETALAQAAFNIGLGIFEGIMGPVENVVASIKETLNQVIGTLNEGISSFNSLPGPDIPLIPMLAEGTPYFGGGMAIVGERGPELVELPRGARVTSTGQTKARLGAMGGVRGNGGVQIIFQGVTITNEADENRLAYKVGQAVSKNRPPAGARGRRQR